MSKAREIVEAVLSDLTGRGGLDGAWDSIDPEIQGEIKDDLTEIVSKKLGEKK